jgi:hypothetical protein
LPQACQPATFRLQGLATLLTAYSLRSRAGFVSHRQRSWDSPFGAFSSRKVSGALPPGRTHLPFLPSVLPPPKRWAGPTGRGSWVSSLPRVPGDHRAFDPTTAGCSLGFRPSRVLLRKPTAGFRPISSHALPRPGGKPPNSPAPQSIARLPLAPRANRTEARPADETTLLGSSHHPDPTHLSEPPSGLWVHLALRHTSLLTGQRSLDGSPRSTGAFFMLSPA